MPAAPALSFPWLSSEPEVPVMQWSSGILVGWRNEKAGEGKAQLLPLLTTMMASAPSAVLSTDLTDASQQPWGIVRPQPVLWATEEITFMQISRSNRISNKGEGIENSLSTA